MLKGITGFVASMVPSLNKDNVLEDCRVSRDQIKNQVIPVYKAADPILKGYKFKSEKMAARQTTAKSMFSGIGNTNVVAYIGGRLPDVANNVDMVADQIERGFSDAIIPQAITFLRASQLRFVEMASFVAFYAPKFLNYVYVCELAENADSDTNIAESITPAEIEYIETRFADFCAAFNVVAGDPGTVSKAFGEIPDIQVTATNEQHLNVTQGMRKMDPLKMGFISARLNPIYHVRMRIAEYQAAKYKASQEERKLLQFRLQHLKSLEAGNPNPKLAKELKVMESRVEGLNYKIAQMEKDYE